MKGLFITATGTDIGKTVISAHLVHQLRRAGRPVLGLKPVASGVRGDALEASDPGRLLAAMGRPVDTASLDAICPWRFEAPLAPDTAAARAGRALGFDGLVRFVRERAAESEVLVEGVGGVRVPLARQHTVCDWMTALGFPAVVVTGSYLGAISHLLSALDSLRAAEIPVRAVVVNRSAEEPMPPAEMLEAAAPWLGDLPTLVFPRLPEPFDLTAGPDLVRTLWPET